MQYFKKTDANYLVNKHPLRTSFPHLIGKVRQTQQKVCRPYQQDRLRSRLHTGNQ